MEFPNSFVNKNFRMNPETEDLISRGDKLKNGYVVLLADPVLGYETITAEMKTKLDHPSIELGDDWKTHRFNRALENNRWCTVTELEIGHPMDRTLISFVGVYADGTKIKRTYNQSFAWYVKNESMLDVAAQEVSAGVVKDEKGFLDVIATATYLLRVRGYDNEADAICLLARDLQAAEAKLEEKDEELELLSRVVDDCSSDKNEDGDDSINWHLGCTMCYSPNRGTISPMEGVTVHVEYGVYELAERDTDTKDVIATWTRRPV